MSLAGWIPDSRDPHTLLSLSKPGDLVLLRRTDTSAGDWSEQYELLSVLILAHSDFDRTWSQRSHGQFRIDVLVNGIICQLRCTYHYVALVLEGKTVWMDNTNTEYGINVYFPRKQSES